MTMRKKFYKKPKKESQKLPSNYRNIPEALNADRVVFFVGFLSVLIAISLISLDIYSNFEKQKDLNNEKFKVLREVSFWENETKVRPNFRDGYMQLAILNFQLKNFTVARQELDKALFLDPNFEKGRELERLLDSI